MHKFGKTLYILTIFLFLYLPILVLIVYSFNDSPYSLVWRGFSLRWYEALSHNNDLQLVALHSVIIGFFAATGATAIGTLAAVSLYRYQFLGKRFLHALIFILIVSPDIVTGISLLILFSAFNISLGFWTILLSHITFCIPFVTVTVYARLMGQNKHLFEAAKDLGATEGVIFRRIMVPLLFPAIVASWLISFTLSMDDVIISFFVSGPQFDVLPLKIFSMVRVGVKPEINALCSVMFALTLIVVFVYQLTLWKKTR